MGSKEIKVCPCCEADQVFDGFMVNCGEIWKCTRCCYIEDVIS